MAKESKRVSTSKSKKKEEALSSKKIEAQHSSEENEVNGNQKITHSESPIESQAGNKKTKEDVVVLSPVHLPENRKHTKAGPVANYLIQSYFDKEISQWVVTVAEFPELKAIGQNRDLLIEEVETRLEDELEILKRRGESLPEPIHTKSYPEKLEVPISSQLYRKLDLTSKQERVSLDSLVQELLNIALARRYYDQNRGQSNRQQPSHYSGQHRPPHRHNPQIQSGNVRGRSFHDAEGNQDNFLEYVRNLEKTGGSPNKWRK